MGKLLEKELKAQKDYKKMREVRGVLLKKGNNEKKDYEGDESDNKCAIMTIEILKNIKAGTCLIEEAYNNKSNIIMGLLAETYDGRADECSDLMDQTIMDIFRCDGVKGGKFYYEEVKNTFKLLGLGRNKENAAPELLDEVNELLDWVEANESSELVEICKALR